MIHVQHLSTRPGATFLVPGTKGVEIHPRAALREGEAIIQKDFPNSFRDTPLLQHLCDNKITRPAVAGMMTQMCIDSTVCAAADLGFECLLAYAVHAVREFNSMRGRTR